jgi:hypothetical protein
MLQIRTNKLENQSTVEFKTLGSVAEVLKQFEAAQLTKNKNGIAARATDGSWANFLFSKKLAAALQSGAYQMNQLAQCQIIDGTNVQGEARYYIGLPQEVGGAYAVADFVAAISGGAKVEKIPASQLLSAL